jgi:hypothetical protein
MLAFSLCAILSSRFVVGFGDSCPLTGCLPGFQDAEISAHGANLGLLQVGLKKERHVDEHSRDDVDNEFMQWLSNNSLTLLQGRMDNPLVNAGALKDLQSYWSNMSHYSKRSGISNNSFEDAANFIDLQRKQQLAFLQEATGRTNANCDKIAACPVSAPENRGSGVSCPGTASTTCTAALCCKPKDMNSVMLVHTANTLCAATHEDIDVDRCKAMDGRKLTTTLPSAGDWTLYYRETASTPAIKYNTCYFTVISTDAKTGYVSFNAQPPAPAPAQTGTATTTGNGQTSATFICAPVLFYRMMVRRSPHE